jgi:hypothetical protein
MVSWVGNNEWIWEPGRSPALATSRSQRSQLHDIPFDLSYMQENLVGLIG